MLRGGGSVRPRQSGTFDHPAAQLQDKAASTLGMLNDFELNSVLYGSRGSIFSCVSLID